MTGSQRLATGRWPRALGAVLALAVIGCGADPPAAGYGPENRAAFIASCASDSDSPLVQDVCACTYEQTRAKLSYDEFVALDQGLKLDPTAALPGRVSQILADCLAGDADL